MVRLIILCLAAVVGLTAASPAEARPFWEKLPFCKRHQPIQQPCVQYKVLYRDCGCQSWQCFGTFANPFRADEAAWSLRYRGFEARVIPF